MDPTLAGVYVAAIAGLATPITVAIVKLVPRRKGNNPGSNPGHTYCDRIGPVEGAIDTIRVLSEERQTAILNRLERIEEKLDSIKS